MAGTSGSQGMAMGEPVELITIMLGFTAARAVMRRSWEPEAGRFMLG